MPFMYHKKPVKNKGKVTKDYSEIDKIILKILNKFAEDGQEGAFLLNRISIPIVPLKFFKEDRKTLVSECVKAGLNLSEIELWLDSLEIPSRPGLYLESGSICDIDGRMIYYQSPHTMYSYIKNYLLFSPAKK